MLTKSRRCLLRLTTFSVILWAVITNLSSADNKLLVTKYGFTKKTDPGEMPDTNMYLAPIDSKFEIKGSIEDAQQGTFLIIRFSNVAKKTSGGKDIKFFNILLLPGYGDINKAPLVSTEFDYLLPKEALPPYDYEVGPRIEIGALTIPFRFQLSDKEISTGGSLGGYVGYRTKVLGFPTSFVGAAGLSLVPITNINASQVETKTGFTLAAGIVFMIAHPAQFGVIIGTDLLGNTPYQYSRKVWLTFGVGYTFLEIPGVQ